MIVGGENGERGTPNAGDDRWRTGGDHRVGATDGQPALSGQADMAPRAPRHCVEYHYPLADETTVHTNAHSTIVMMGEGSADIRANEHEADSRRAQRSNALSADGIGTYPCNHRRRTGTDGSEEGTFLILDMNPNGGNFPGT